MEYRVVINVVVTAASMLVLSSCGEAEVPSHREGYVPPTERLIRQAALAEEAQEALLAGDETEAVAGLTKSRNAR